VERNTLVVNFYGGPNARKSTTAAAVYAELKMRGINCELVREFAKDLVWEESFRLMENQTWIFGVQYHRMWTLLGKVDVIVNDAPLLHSIIYGAQNDELHQLVWRHHNRLKNLNVFCVRGNDFQQEGRVHTLEQSIEIDHKVKDLLKNSEGYHKFPGGDRKSYLEIGDLVEEMLGNQ